MKTHRPPMSLHLLFSRTTTAAPAAAPPTQYHPYHYHHVSIHVKGFVFLCDYCLLHSTNSFYHFITVQQKRTLDIHNIPTPNGIHNGTMHMHVYHIPMHLIPVHPIHSNLNIHNRDIIRIIQDTRGMDIINTITAELLKGHHSKAIRGRNTVILIRQNFQASQPRKNHPTLSNQLRINPKKPLQKPNRHPTPPNLPGRNMPTLTPTPTPTRTIRIGVLNTTITTITITGVIIIFIGLHPMLQRVQEKLRGL